MSSPPRLLAIYSTPRILGGGEISFTLSLEALRQAGCQVFAATPGPGPLSDRLDRIGLATVVLPQPTLRRDFGWRHLFRARSDWLQTIDQLEPDIVHCNAIRPALYAQAVGRRLGIPTVMHARKSERLPGIDHFLALRLDGILCTSRIVRRRFPRWPRAARCEILYNAVDLARLESPSPDSVRLRDRWQAGSRDRLVGVIGRLSPVKGQDRIVRAAPAILREAPDTRFIFVGAEDPDSPGFQRRLEAEVRASGLGDRFVFAGPIDDPAEIYHALDIVAYPTRSEGFGRIVIEAGAARKPLVTSDIEVVREVLSPDLADLTVPCDGSVEPLARRIVDLCNRDDLRRTTAERLHAHVRDHFGIDVHRERLLRFYAQILGGR